MIEAVSLGPPLKIIEHSFDLRAKLWVRLHDPRFNPQYEVEDRAREGDKVVF